MKKLYVAMVGLPARGKSTLARRIQSGLEQQGVHTAIFNNGDTRRRLFGVASAKSDFFDPANETALRNRRNIARLTMEAARQWLASRGDVAIIDENADNVRQLEKDFSGITVEGVPMDMAEAERQLRRGASGGVTAAMCNLGVILSESDPDESLGWFEKAAELGNLKAVRNLAASYSSGCGARLDKARAAEYYRRAADMGDVDSMCVLASMLRNGDGVPMDKAGAADLYRRAADMGDPDAQYDLAFMLDSGEGIPQDRAEAERLFALSAEQGDTDACLCIGGILYERGDYAGAEGHFMTAALKGDVKAAYNLGLMYSEGSLGEPDMEKAEEWFESAASEGFAYAQTSLAGILYSKGDLEGAAGWYRKAAEQGEPTAMYNLGAFGVSGMIKMDEGEAMDLLVRAASAGVEEARVLLSRITSG